MFTWLYIYKSMILIYKTSKTVALKSIKNRRFKYEMWKVWVIWENYRNTVILEMSSYNNHGFKYTFQKIGIH